MNVEASLIGRVETASALSRYGDIASNSIANPPRILVVDDDPSMQHMIVNYTPLTPESENPWAR
jgi:hypothetical protein